MTKDQMRLSFLQQGMDEEEIDEMLNFNPEVETSFNTSNDIPMEDFTIKRKD